MSELKVDTALLSVFDKSGIVPFARTLAGFGVTIFSTGGTYRFLSSGGVNVKPLEEISPFPEMLDGRVKTLQPEIFAGILALRSSSDHQRQISEKGLRLIDMVVCNFYPFEMVARDSNADEAKLLETVDIGGPSMVRAAAKNFESVCVIPSPDFYERTVKELGSLKGKTSLEFRREMALAAFERVADYDVSIYNTLHRKFRRDEAEFPKSFFLSARMHTEPKYGENPDQRAMVYSLSGFAGGVPSWRSLFGDNPSYNNYLDMASSFEILSGFEDNPAAATVKHGHISGFALSTTIADAYRLAHACDPEADFGNTTVLNRRVDKETANLIGSADGSDSVYTEIIIAPGYDPEALEILKSRQKKKMRIIEANSHSEYEYDLKLIEGLLMVQKATDYKKKLDERKISIETKTKPTLDEVRVLEGLWEIARRVESNAIVIGNGLSSSGNLQKLWTLGVASFRKRNGATKIALDNAGLRARGSYCASDGFFPFVDSIDLLGEAGVKGVIQPGGSIKDKAVVEAADRYSMSMIFTHERAFKH